jgi:hypothetical protein
MAVPEIWDVIVEEKTSHVHEMQINI